MAERQQVSGSTWRQESPRLGYDGQWEQREAVARQKKWAHGQSSLDEYDTGPHTDACPHRAPGTRCTAHPVHHVAHRYDTAASRARLIAEHNKSLVSAEPPASSGALSLEQMLREDRSLKLGPPGGTGAGRGIARRNTHDGSTPRGEW